MRYGRFFFYDQIWSAPVQGEGFPAVAWKDDTIFWACSHRLVFGPGNGPACGVSLVRT